MRTSLQLWLHFSTVFKYAPVFFLLVQVIQEMPSTNLLMVDQYKGTYICFKASAAQAKCQQEYSSPVSKQSHGPGKQVESLDDQVRELGALRAGNGSARAQCRAQCAPSPNLPRGHLGKAHGAASTRNNQGDNLCLFPHF